MGTDRRDGPRLDVNPFFLTGDPAPLAIGEGPYQGAVVVVRTDVPYGVAAALGQAVAAYAEAPAGSAEEAAALRQAWTVFTSEVLTGWNLHDKLGAVPATYAAIARVSPRFIVLILGLWADLMTGEAA